MINSLIIIQTHFKPTETLQYTHFSSCHPLSAKKGFVKGEALRLLRTNSVKESFELKKLRLLERGYPKSFAEDILTEIKFSMRNTAFSPVDCCLVVVGELACLSDLVIFTIGGIPPVGPTLAGRSKGRGQTKW